MSPLGDSLISISLCLPLVNTFFEIFKKFYYEGKKVKQIAKEMHMTNSNVKTKLHRTRKKIKEILKVGGF